MNNCNCDHIKELKKEIRRLKTLNKSNKKVITLLKRMIRTNDSLVRAEKTLKNRMMLNKRFDEIKDHSEYDDDVISNTSTEQVQGNEVQSLKLNLEE